MSEPTTQRIVVVDGVPRPQRGAGYPRAFALLEELACAPNTQVTLLATGFIDDADTIGALERLGVDVVASVEPSEWLTAHRFTCSVIILSRPDTRQFEAVVRRTQPQAKLVYDCEALSYRRIEGSRRFGVLSEDPDQSRAWELALIDRSDMVMCVTEDERSVAHEVRSGRPARVVSYGVAPVESLLGWGERSDLLFFGGFAAGDTSPNVDAVRWLVDAVLPVLWDSHPDLVLHIVGTEPTHAVRALGSRRVDVVGEVDDPLPWLLRSRVLVVPMRFGAGLKLRFVDAMAAGLPFVTTPIGAEGIELGSDRRLLVGESPEELATAVRRLHDDRESWESAQRRLRKVHERSFTRDRFRASVVRVLAELGIAPPRPDASEVGQSE